ncbi:7102_t:CDS:1 [Cetraspora pellucida]|uniref:7102_t:CDS:1 n=1 Tax=Cetraspora pellucida TaxID=1433469 RepID=A0A9N9JWX0_9GLOM|nr:7102_t:CDS:1 [Cetraspora pellucida]
MSANSIWNLFLIIHIFCFTAINIKADHKKSDNAIITTEFNKSFESYQFNHYQLQNFTERSVDINIAGIAGIAAEIIVPSTLFAIPTETESTKTTPTVALDCCDTGGPGIINKLPGAFYSISYDAVSLEDCCRKCSADSNCIGWGYNIKTKSCFAESVNDPDAEEFCKYSTDHYANFVGGRPGCGGCRAKF